MKLTIEISDELINNLLNSGRDGGIAYWASHYDRTGVISSKMLPARVHERDTDCWYQLNVSRGLGLMISQCPRYLDPANLDATAGDVFIQLCAFGEIKYG